MFALLSRLSDPCYKYSRKVRHLERTPLPETNQLLKNRPRKSFIENLKSNQNRFSIIFCPSEKQDCRDQNYLTNLIHFDYVRVTESKCILNFAFCFVHHFEGLIFYTYLSFFQKFNLTLILLRFKILMATSWPVFLCFAFFTLPKEPKSGKY